MNFLIDLATLELSALALLALAAWVYLTWSRAGFWKADIWLEPELISQATSDASVAVVIPARDEAETIGQALTSLAKQDYAGPVTIWVVDDQSSDATADIARAVSGNIPVNVISGTPLPPGWSGKVWAMAQGVEAATKDPATKPDYLLLTDADITYRQGVLKKLVTKAEANKLTFVSLMARLDSRGLWGKLLIPAFIYFFQLIYPFRRANTRYDSTAGAAGGCFLIREDALAEAGGLVSIKGDIIDDCALARTLKKARPANDTLTALTHDVWSLRDNRSLESIWNMVARTAFTQLGNNWLALTGAMLGLILTFVIPVWAVASWLSGGVHLVAGLAGLGAWLLMARTYLPTIRMYGLHSAWSLCLPAATLIYGAATLASALRHARGSGARWKGRSYS